MNRLTAIGLASLAAYGLLIASKYLGVVSAARPERAPQAAIAPIPEPVAPAPEAKPRPAPPPSISALPPPLPRGDIRRVSQVALDFRNARDLKAFADGLAARGAFLTGDERYHLAKALEECQFTTSINEDLATYSAKQRRQFVASLPIGDPLNDRRIAAYDAVDNTQRCLGFRDASVSPKEIEELYRLAAQQGDPRAQARLITAELEKNLNNKGDSQATANEELAMLIGLLESRDPEALLYVGQYLARNDVRPNLRVGPNGEVPEPSAFLGGFSLVACDIGQECGSVHNRDLQSACAYGGYCNAQSFEELYQNFLASPWAYAQAIRYRNLIHTAIRDRNWTLIGLTPKLAARDRPLQ